MEIDLCIIADQKYKSLKQKELQFQVIYSLNEKCFSIKRKMTAICMIIWKNKTNYVAWNGRKALYHPYYKSLFAITPVAHAPEIHIKTEWNTQLMLHMI